MAWDSAISSSLGRKLHWSFYFSLFSIPGYVTRCILNIFCKLSPGFLTYLPLCCAFKSIQCIWMTEYIKIRQMYEYWCQGTKCQKHNVFQIFEFQITLAEISQLLNINIFSCFLKPIKTIIHNKKCSFQNKINNLLISSIKLTRSVIISF